MKEIVVVDSRMGSGKTSWIINQIKNSDTEEKYIYVTPYIDECERIGREIPEKNFIEISKEKGIKLAALKKYLVDGKNIATTHALFQRFDNEVLALLSANNYNLIIDEENTVIEQIEISPKDLQMLFDTGMLEVKQDSRVEWTDEDYTGKFKEIKQACSMGNVFFFNGCLLLWLFPVTIFNAMKSVTILTYRFAGSYERAYFDLNAVSYVYKSVRKIDGEFTLVDYIEKEENISELKKLINIYEGDLNSIGEKRTALSYTQYEKWKRQSSPLLSKLKKNLHNYFQNIQKASSKEILWTCPKDSRDKLKGKGYARSYLSFNARATNKYRFRNTLAYCNNLFVQPQIKSFFHKNGVEINEEEYALASLLQWLWRSAIREGKPVQIYIPSSRMRGLLKNYLEGDM